MLAQYRQAVDEHRQRIYSFAHYSLRAAEDAEDVTQEVFIKLWQHWKKIDHGKLGAWLMRVAHNAVIDHVRKRNTVNRSLDQYTDVETSVDDKAVDQAGQLDQVQFKERLQAAIKTLADPFRSVLIMRDIQGQTYAEIEESLQMSASQVKVYLHRARRKLRENADLRALFSQHTGREAQESDKVKRIAVVAADKGDKHVE